MERDKLLGGYTAHEHCGEGVTAYDNAGGQGKSSASPQVECHEKVKTESTSWRAEWWTCLQQREMRVNGAVGRCSP